MCQNINPACIMDEVYQEEDRKAGVLIYKLFIMKNEVFSQMAVVCKYKAKSDFSHFYISLIFYLQLHWCTVKSPL